jgi:hypothetical protein
MREEKILAGGKNLSVTEPGTDSAKPLAESAGVEVFAVHHGNPWMRQDRHNANS